MGVTDSFMLRGLLSLAVAICSQANAIEAFPIVDCQALLGSPARPHRLRLLASDVNLAIQLPSYGSGVFALNTYSLKMTLEGLRITRDEFRSTFAGKKVLLIGEGFGELLPALLDIGAQPVAVDPVYTLEEVPDEDWKLNAVADRPNIQPVVSRLRAYLEKYDEYLIPAVAQNLPFPDASFDFSISHMLLTNLIHPVHAKIEDDPVSAVIRRFQSTIMESARVLKPGGQALHVFGADEGCKNDFFGWQGWLTPPQLIGFAIAKEIRFELTAGRILQIEHSAAMGAAEDLIRDSPEANVRILRVLRR